MKLKLLAHLLLLNTAIINAENVEAKIAANETVINSLQKILDDMQASGETADKTSALQAHIDEVIAAQNKLLEAKSTGKTETSNTTASSDNSWEDTTINQEGLDEKIRKIVKEELAKHFNGSIPSKPIAPGANPYDTQRVPTEAELSATAQATANAPALPEATSKATAQYQQALGLYNSGAYKEAGASFSRIVKTYPKDPIVAKALVHLAFCLEKQGDLESATVVCESALTKKIDDGHKVDCNLIRLKHAVAKGNDKDTDEIKKILKASVLSAEQKAEFEKITAKKTEAKNTPDKHKQKKSAANS